LYPSLTAPRIVSKGTPSRTAVRAARLKESGPWVDGVKVTPLLFGDLPELYGVDRWSFEATDPP
jgi:hypothetical protein